MPPLQWTQIYAPLAGSLGLSVLAAALPLLVVALLLGVWRAPAWRAAAVSLAVACLVAVLVYGMPVRLALAATAYGAAFGLFPIGWLVYSAILLFDVTVEAGCFDAIKRSLRRVSGDQRLLVLLIAFCFGAFIEGTSGFGTPVAVSASLLAGLGLPAFTAAGLCLVANTAPVAFGALATPIVTLAGVTGLPLMLVERGRRPLVSPLIAVIIPMYLMVLMAGWSGAVAVWPAALGLRPDLRDRAIPRVELHRSVPDRHHQRAGLGDRAVDPDAVLATRARVEIRNTVGGRRRPRAVGGRLRRGSLAAVHSARRSRHHLGKCARRARVEHADDSRERAAASQRHHCARRRSRRPTPGMRPCSCSTG